MLDFTIFFEHHHDEFGDEFLDEFCFCLSFSPRCRPVTNFVSLLSLSFRYLVVLGSS